MHNIFPNRFQLFFLYRYSSRLVLWFEEEVDWIWNIDNNIWGRVYHEIRISLQNKLTFFRSSRSLVFYKKADPKHFVSFTGKELCRNPFLLKLRPTLYNYTKNEALTRVFSSELSKYFKTNLLQDNCGWLFL